MTKRMLIDASHSEETRVVVVNGSRLEEFDFESSTKKQLKGTVYLAKVTRVEPSLQAAFVEYGGNRHGFWHCMRMLLSHVPPLRCRAAPPPAGACCHGRRRPVARIAHARIRSPG